MENIAQKTPISAEVYERYALFATGGKQYQAIEGRTLEIEKIEGEPGQKIQFSEVLLRKQGVDQLQIGQPTVPGAVITASIVKHGQGSKLVVFKFKRRKKLRVKKGHRQEHTVIRIESI